MTKYKYEPDLVTPPGETLLEHLFDLSVRNFSALTAMNRLDVLKLIDGELPIDEPLAKLLEECTDIPKDFWLAREKRYREFLAKQEAKEGQ